MNPPKWKAISKKIHLIITCMWCKLLSRMLVGEKLLSHVGSILKLFKMNILN